jgi:hypothetical protein
LINILGLCGETIKERLAERFVFVILEYGDGTVVLSLCPDIFYEFFFRNTKRFSSSVIESGEGVGTHMEGDMASLF